MKLRIVLGIFAIFFLTGCATQAKYETQVQKWIGASEKQLVEDWGVPTGTYEVQGVRFLEYRSSETRLIGGSPFFFGGMPPEIEKFVCATTFQIENGFVTKVTFRGNNCVATDDENVAAEQKKRAEQK